MKNKAKNKHGKLQVWIALLLLFLMPSSALAVNMSNWYPQQGAKSIATGGAGNKAWKDKGGKSATASGNNVYSETMQPEYTNVIVKTKKSSYKVIRGNAKGPNSKYYYLNGGEWLEFGNAGNQKLKFFLDENSKGGIVVQYNNYKIYDNNEKKYVKINVKATVKSWAKKEAQYTNRAKTQKRPMLALDTKIKGLPALNIINVSSLQIHYDFYRADNGKKYNVFTNLTYRDVDCGQAISINKCDGSLATSNTDLLWKTDDGYQVFTSKGLYASDSANKRKMFNFMFGANNIDLIYSTDGYKVKNGKRVTGPPNGIQAYFGTSVKPMTKVKLPDFPGLSKEVTDNDKVISDEATGKVMSGDETDTSRNTIAGLDDTFTYTIQQRVPSGMDTGNDGISALSFTDNLDDCITLAGSVNKAVTVKVDGEKQGASKFASSLTGQKLVVKAVNPKKNADLYNDGAGSIVTVTIKCKIKEDVDFKELEAHEHLQSNGLYKFSNKATRKYTTGAGSGTANTNTVYTNVPKDTHDLTIRKSLRGKAASTGDVFNYSVVLSGLESEATYKIESSHNGNPESFTASSDGTYSLTNIKLSGNEYIRIDKLPSGATYQITENGSRYTPRYEVVEGSSFTNTDAGPTSDHETDRPVRSGLWSFR